MNSLLEPEVLQVVQDRLGALRPDSDARWGRMSVHQAVCHLADAFRMVLGERPTDLRGNLLSRTVIRFVALTLPVTWPKSVATAPEADQERGGTPPSEFRADMAELEVLLGRFVAAAGRDMSTHPLFGHLTPGEWGRWGYRHMDHHLRQFGV